MVKMLTPHGNSAAVILDRPVLDLLRISFNTPLEISTDGTRIIITPLHANGEAGARTKAVPSKGQDRESGAAASRWGHAMGKAVAGFLGGIPLSTRTNEMVYEDGRWVAKSAKHQTIEIGVPTSMLGRLTGIIAALEDRSGDFVLYKISPEWYRKHMRPNRVQGDRLMMVRCADIRKALTVLKRMPG